MRKKDRVVGKKCLTYLNDEQFSELYELIRKTVEFLEEELKDNNLESLGFIDVGCNGYQLYGVHKLHPLYAFSEVTIKYDLSNFDKKIKEFVARWKARPEEAEMIEETLGKYYEK